jgi:hypothetical protein
MEPDAAMLYVAEAGHGQCRQVQKRVIQPLSILIGQSVGAGWPGRTKQDIVARWLSQRNKGCCERGVVVALSTQCSILYSGPSRCSSVLILYVARSESGYLLTRIWQCIQYLLGFGLRCAGTRKGMDLQTRVTRSLEDGQNDHTVYHVNSTMMMMGCSPYTTNSPR